MNTASSWSWPIGFWPLRAITPITSKGVARMRISRPTGSSSPNRFSATVAPRITTLRAWLASSAPNRRPCSGTHSWATKKSGSAAITVADQFWLPATSWKVWRIDPTATSTSGTSRAIATASS